MSEASRDGGAMGTRGVGDLRVLPVVSVRADASLGEVARVMFRTAAPMVCIEGSDRVLARDDVLRALTEHNDDVDENTPVGSIARGGFLAVGRATPALAVLGELVRCELPGVLVTDEYHAVVGCVPLRDLVAALLDELSLLAGLRHVLHVERTSW